MKHGPIPGWLLAGFFAMAVATQAAPISSGENKDGTIIAGGTESWTFTVAVNQTIDLAVGELSGGTGFSPRVQLFGPTNNLITFDSGGASARINPYRATVAGTYTATVSGTSASQAGTYRLRLFLTPAPFAVPAGDEGGPLVLGSNHAGSISAGDIDAWTVNVTAGESLDFRIGEVSGGTAFTPLIYLYDPNGAQITYNYGATDARINHRTTLTGTYTLMVAGYNDGDNGTYVLTAFKSPGSFVVPTGDEGGALVSGQNYVGAITVGDLDAWTVSVTAGQYLNFRVGEVSGGTAFTPLIFLYDPNGVQETHNYGATDARIGLRATLTGTYTLIVAGYNDGDNGTYRLTFTRSPDTPVVPPGDDGGPLISGQNYAGTITVGDLDTWTVNATAGNYLLFRVGEVSGGTAFSPLVALYDPNGAQVTYDYDSVDARIAHRANLSGLYTFVVAGYNDGDQGTYRLTFFQAPNSPVVPAGDEGGPLTNGLKHTGTIAVGDQDAWTVKANVNDYLYFRVGETSGGTAFSPLLHVFDPNGALVTYDYDSVDSRIGFRCNIAGTYTALVSGYNDGDAGTYDLHFVRTPVTPLQVPAGDEGGNIGSTPGVDGTITVGDADAYVVLGTAGTTINVTATELSGGTAFTPQVAILDTGGNIVRNTWNATAATTTYTVTTTGLHVILVAGYNDGDTGTYRLVISGASAPVLPSVAVQPLSQGAPLGSNVTLSPTVAGSGPFAYQWKRNGIEIPGAESLNYTLSNLQPASAGIYSLVVYTEAGTTESAGAIVAPTISTKVTGTAYEFAGDIHHPNGNVYDQLLITGTAATYTSDPGQIVRASFLDLNDDIVQLEFSGPGSVTVQMAGATGPATPVKYNQPSVQYMRGQVSIYLVGATENTNLGIYTVGVMTNPNPALYVAGASFDGFADLGLIAIQSPDGRFSGVRVGSTELFGDTGYTGIYAPGIRFAGPLNLHNVSASGTAAPFLLTGTIDTGRISITGGDLFQPNGRAITFGDVSDVYMVAGTNSHGVPAPAQVNRGVLMRNGVNVTSQVIHNP